MLRFLLVGLFVAVFVSIPSVRTDDELTEQEVLEAVERALDGQLKDREVRKEYVKESDGSGDAAAAAAAAAGTQADSFPVGFGVVMCSGTRYVTERVLF
ncbi:hypothetical protein MAR_031020 [Mya arenaria]|uniref:Uncharacterized protein n=1 Tax=Mya arenaria TaxID=6604 RepID=A0ABY7F5W8_MYAAR|nr:hypothetical protein MAR_031020 [Mya arenaria]